MTAFTILFFLPFALLAVFLSRWAIRLFRAYMEG
jgi:hypothetical protein